LTRLRAFRDERDFAQFHTPQSLAVAVAVEAGELLSEFRFAIEDAAFLDEKRRTALAAEAADVLAFLVYFSDACGFDLIEALKEKLADNERRYPVDLVRGDPTARLEE
jgi:dCTP diphosphatase